MVCSSALAEESILPPSAPADSTAIPAPDSSALAAAPAGSPARGALKSPTNSPKKVPAKSTTAKVPGKPVRKPVKPGTAALAPAPHLASGDASRSQLFMVGMSSGYAKVALLDSSSSPGGLQYSAFFQHSFSVWHGIRPLYELGFRHESLSCTSQVSSVKSTEQTTEKVTVKISEKYVQSAVLVGGGIRIQPLPSFDIGVLGVYEYGLSPTAELKSDAGASDTLKLEGVHVIGLVARPLYHITNSLLAGGETQLFFGRLSYKGSGHSLWGASVGLLLAYEL